MPSPEYRPDHHPALYMLLQELRGLLLSPALWLMLIVLSLLTGFSFFQAVHLFSEAGRTALTFPELARGMNPLDGIFIPCFGAYYLSQTLLLPFVAIRLIGLDKQSGALTLLLQMPLSPSALCGLKLAAMGVLWLFSLLPAISVLLIWLAIGGHIHWPEIALLLFGHGLYALTVITLAMFVAVVSDSLPTAAMVCLAVTLGSWVLDFAASGNGAIMQFLHSLSFNVLLHQLETGLLTMGGVAPFTVIAALFFLLTITWIHPGRKLTWKITRSLATIIVLTVALIVVMRVPGTLDVTEDRRHSFNPADSRALNLLGDQLTLTIHLNPEDSRRQDMEKGVLARLQRTVPDLQVVYVEDHATGLFAAPENESYGLIEYLYHDRHDQSYSNSPEEMLAIIYTLAGVQVSAETVADYPGYPLVVKDPPGKWWFYLWLPLLFAGGGLWCCCMGGIAVKLRKGR